MVMEDSRLIKCVLVGDRAVGKTSLIISYVANNFLTEYLPTVFDTYTTHVMINGRQLNVGLFDTAGDDEFDRVRPLSYLETEVFIVCFSLVKPTSYDNVRKKWLPEISHHCPNVPVVLVGTEQDLREDSKIIAQLSEENSKPITHDQGMQLMESINAVKYVECSALTQEGVKTVIEESARAVMGS